MSAALRAREEAAIARIAAALGFTLDASRLRADELEEMAALVEGLAWGEAPVSYGREDAVPSLEEVADELDRS